MLRTVARSVRLLALPFLAGTALAQNTDIPVAPRASTSATAPVAQPVDTAETVPGSSIVVAAPAAARFDAAMASYNAGQYVDAVTAFSNFISSFPQDRRREEALYRLAESYRSLNRTEDALAAYTYQVQAYPDGPLRVNGELRRGAILYDTGKLADAAAPLQFVADKGDGELQQAAKYLLARVDLATNKEPDARALLQGLIDAQPPGKFSGNAAQSLAELDDAQGKPAEALPLWQKALALSTDPAVQAVAAARGGWSALEAKQLDTAEKLFQATRKIDVASAAESRKAANTGLLRILFQQKRYSDWLDIYAAEKDKLLESARAEILYDLGHAQFVTKHWAESAAAFDQYLKEFPQQETAATAAYERFLALAQLDKTKTISEGLAYLQAWPKSPYRNQVQLLQAQELSREKKYADSLPLWESLAKVDGDKAWPHQEILLDLARTYDQLNDFPKAAAGYQAYLDVANTKDGNAKTAKTILQTEARLAVCLQKSNQLLAATDAWKVVQTQAPDGSPEQQAALESLGLIYARGGPAQEQAAVAIFQKLLQNFPKSSLAPMAAYSVGDYLFRTRDYTGAEPLLLQSRKGDPQWIQPATQRLALAAFGRQDFTKTVGYLNEYDALTNPAPAPLPAALFYWLAETSRKAGDLPNAETYYTRVTKHRDPGDLLAGAWWQLGEVQGLRKEWPAAVASYEKYRQLKPESKDATVVLLALGRAQLGAGNAEAAKELGNQALLQEPEGPRSAASRTLIAEACYAAANYPEAARMFATLAVLFDDPRITPQALARAGDSFEKAGDAKSAAIQRQKLQEKYPQFQPTPYL